jgi:hypothetical protein
MPPIPFSAVTRPAEIAPGRFAVDVHPEWTVDGKPNGGYLLAAMGRAAAAVSPHVHPVATSAHFLRPAEPGPADISVEILRSGRSITQLRAALSQGGRGCIEALITAGTLDPHAEPNWSAVIPQPGVEAFDDCVRLPPRSPSGLPVPIMAQSDLRLEPGSLAFAAGRPSGRGELHGWLQLPAGESFDPVALLYAVDAPPPATFEIVTTGWVPTLELTVYVRAFPAPGPVRFLQKAELIDGGRVNQYCWVWDGTGRLVAQGTQLAGIRLD